MKERAARLGWKRRDEEEEAEATTQAEAITAEQPAPRPEAPQVELAEETRKEQAVPLMLRVSEVAARLNLRERARAIAGSVAAGFAVAVRGIATVLQRMLPEDVAAGPRGKAVNTLLMTIAVLIPVAVAVLVSASFTQQNALERFNDKLSTARQEAAQAQAVDAKDQAAQRQHWDSALKQANAALEIFPDSPDALTVRDDAQRAIDQLDNVLRVNPSLLWDFHSPGPHRLAVQDTNLFVLDRAAQCMSRLTLNEAGDGVTDKDNPERLCKGQNVSDRQVLDLIDLVWMPIGGTRTRASLVILDGGGLLDYDLAWNLRAVALGQGQTLPDARAIAGFGGNLYVLDANAGQIWRYRPQGDGYGSAPEAYFDKSLDLSNAIDLAIDGSVYVLLSDGNVRKFFGGDEKKFVVSGMNEPLKMPVALAVDAETRKATVYVADKGSARIVQLSPDGAFTRQIRATGDAFNALEDLVVDERNGRLFVISGGKLYVARVPAAP
jgi:hypothetical protein